MRADIGNAEMPAAPIMGLTLFLTNKFMIFRKQYTAYGIKHECNETQSQNKQRVHARKIPPPSYAR